MQVAALKRGIPAAISFLMSDAQQSEFVGIVENGSACSLDVERKHHQDRASETQKVTGVARASRNSIMQQYRPRRRESAQRNDKLRQELGKLQYMNLRALAIKRNPHSFGRARGKLLWEADVSHEGMARTAVPGDEQALKKYVHDSLVELTEAVEKMKSDARISEVHRQSNIPYTNADWLTWIEEHDAEFRDRLSRATSERRRFCKRLVTTSDLPTAVRLEPIPAHAPLTNGYASWSRARLAFIASLAVRALWNFVRSFSFAGPQVAIGHCH